MKKSNGALLFAAGLAIATGLTFSLGLRATREWQRSTAQAAETRGNEVVTLLDVALERDMKGGQISVLMPFNQTVLMSAPYDLADRFARGFARFPYLESFFVWTEGSSTYVFNRADRRPSWDSSEGAGDPYPVVLRRDPGPLRDLLTLARARSSGGTRFALIESTIGGVPYQTLAYLLYDRAGSEAHLSGVAGMMVNLDWVRAHYFADFIREIQNVIGDTTLSIEILDAAGKRVAAVGPTDSGTQGYVRTFPLLFADQALVSDLPRAAALPVWSARVGVAGEASVAAAARGSSRTLALLGVAGLASLIGLGFAVRAARAAADLANVQSEFVSAVSHEMKTPLSLIKLASDTLENGRYDSPAAIADYGRMMGVEVQHLGRLIDNVLCYARINDSSSAYSLETLDAVELVHESIDRFRPQLDNLGIQVHFNVPAEPVLVAADYLMMTHVFDNLVDNVTKYAATGAWLQITVRPAGDAGNPGDPGDSGDDVRIDLADCGEGIAPADLPRVFDKFFRPHGNRQRGAGLGLAIVRRIVEDHNGSVTISSVPGQGTVVTLRLPAAVST